MRHTTTVRWTLTELPDGAGTRLRLDHQGFEGFPGAILAFMHGGGWKKFVTVRLPASLAARTAAGPRSSS